MRRLIRKISNRFINRSLHSKLMFSYILIIMISFGISMVAIIYTTTAAYQKQMEDTAEKGFEQAKTFLEYQLDLVIVNSNSFVSNQEVKSILEKNQAEYETDYEEQKRDREELTDLLGITEQTEGIREHIIYLPEWFAYSKSSNYFLSLDEFKKSGLYSRLLVESNATGNGWFFTGRQTGNVVKENDYVIDFYRNINRSDLFETLIGVEKITLEQSGFKDIVQKSNMTRRGMVYIQNSYGELVLCSDEERFREFAISKEQRIELNQADYNWNDYNLNKRRYLVKNGQIKNTDWTMVAVIPYSEILGQSVQTGIVIILITLFLGVLAYLIARKISSNIVGRIKLLANSMQEIERDNMQPTRAGEVKDEIGYLVGSYNNMLIRIEGLMEQERQNGIALKKQELNALQAQINPHFLYNTLDLINWEAMDAGAPKISRIVQELARFYKLSLNKGKYIVTLEEEISHVKSYVTIQNFRFEDKIKLIVNVDEALLEYKILKIILQPIVENSILHGILFKKDHEGIIIIDAHIQGMDLILTVQDDGVGMTRQHIEDVFVNRENRKHGYGVRNIHERLRLYYGEEYGLSYESEEGVGTCVTIKIRLDI